MILDPKRIDAETDRFLHGLKKRFRKYAAKEAVPAYYARFPLDVIVIDVAYLREQGLLKPDPVIFAALHELHHALHPRSSSNRDAWDWASTMIRLMKRRGYVSPQFSKTRGDIEPSRRTRRKRS